MNNNPWTAAETVARLARGRTVVVGQGESMLPLYPAGTVLVIERVAWSQLRAGMTVIYEREGGLAGEMVGHVLTTQEARGWVAQGLNNDDPDDMRVTPGNYVGTVVAAFRRVTPGGDPATLLAADMPRGAMMRAALDQGGVARGRPTKTGSLGSME
ncbi:S24/S26 family peptidase [Horticoccus luteus]|uniref:S24/S26 family peptidase n=1 Tax=Horticoccus luteus TaxID=2862869 RepID=A0A8F9TVL0_9BACT|nr:S24/S26 family peptidase [Horticoccus luteus]QYM80069.1 S24/S26 family peptidase [Horticoccus luteus]